MPGGIGLMRRDVNCDVNCSYDVNRDVFKDSAPPSPISENREHFVPLSPKAERVAPIAAAPSPGYGPFKIQIDCSSGRRLVFDEDPMKNAKAAFEIADKFEKMRDIVENGPFAFSEAARREIRTATCMAHNDFHEYAEMISASIAKMKSECKCINCQVK